MSTVCEIALIPTAESRLSAVCSWLKYNTEDEIRRRAQERSKRKRKKRPSTHKSHHTKGMRTSGLVMVHENKLKVFQINREVFFEGTGRVLAPAAGVWEWQCVRMHATTANHAIHDLVVSHRPG